MSTKSSCGKPAPQHSCSNRELEMLFPLLWWADLDKQVNQQSGVKDSLLPPPLDRGLQIQ